MGKTRITVPLICALTLLAAISLVFALSACGKRRGNPPALTIPRTPQTYEEIARRINALPPPDGVEPELFLKLKAALKGALAEREAAGVSFIGGPATGDENVVTDLDYQEDGEGGWELTWHYKNVGDYNQDGIVNIEEITQIAMHYGEDAVPPTTIAIDGNNDGKIDIADITPVAIHFLYEAEHYSARSSDTEDGSYTTEVGQVTVNDGVVDSTGFLSFDFTLPTTESGWYRVVPLDSSQAEGVFSTPVYFELPGEAPHISGVSPTQGYAGAEATFSATVTGTEPLSFEWRFGGGATPNTISLRNPQVQLGAIGNYSASVTVTNDYGYDMQPFTLNVQEPPPTNRIDITAAKTTISVGETTTILVMAEDMAHTFSALGSAVMAYDLSIVEPDWPTFNIGSVGGDWWYKDGIWEEGFGDMIDLLSPRYFFQHQAEGWVYHTHPVNSHLSSVEVNITPTSGFIPERSSGELYNFEFAGVGGGMTVLYFQSVVDTGGPEPNKRTFYHDDAMEEHLYELGEPLVINVEPATTEPPVVTWLHPQYAETATEQTFSAGISGSPPFTLTWDFGSGTVPDYWEGPLPVVTMGEPGQYDGTLTVDGAGGTVDHDFVYFVTTPDYDEVENNDAPAEANPLPPFPVYGFRGSVGFGGYDGDDDDYYTFYAQSGDFFDVHVSALPGTEDLSVELLDSSLTVLASAPGESDAPALSWLVLSEDDYYIHISTDSVGAVNYTFNAHLEVLDPWPSNPIDDSAASHEFAVAPVQGYPCVAFRKGDAAESDIYFAHNEYQNGMGTWTVSLLVLGSLTFGSGLDIREIDDRPAIACVSSDGPVYFLINQNSDGTGGWDYYRVSDATSECTNVTLGTVQDNPALVYYDVYAQRLEYARCDNADGSGNWQMSYVHFTADPILSPSLRVLSTDRPATSYADSSANTVFLAIADNNDGTHQWDVYTVDTNLEQASTTSLTINDGRPAVCYTLGGGGIRYAINEQENGRGGWLTQSLPFAAGNNAQRLRLHAGRPALAFDGLGDTVRYATNEEADGSAPWDFVVAATDAELKGSTSFRIINGRPAFVYRDTVTDGLIFARRDY